MNDDDVVEVKKGIKGDISSAWIAHIGAARRFTL